MSTNNDLAELLFPDVKLTTDEIFARYPDRWWDFPVLRYAPSPTWFLHLWSVYISLIDDMIAHQDGWVFYCRIEDTDSKREIAWATELFLSWLKKFKIILDEWLIWDSMQEVWNYWPYKQSQRNDIYRAFAKKLVSEWKAYPCFMTEWELEELRKQQTEMSQPTWVYGQYSKWRNMQYDDILSEFNTWKQFVVRFKSNWRMTWKTILNDAIRWKVEIWENYMDAVVLKKDWTPTYHFAHVIDDRLMWTTLVTRWDEWIASYPLNAEMNESLGFPPLKYAHIAPLLKLDGWNKRKLSKRKDKEADVEFFFEQGYTIEAIIDYLFSIMDSSFEAWRLANPGKSFREFHITLERLPHSWALFDTAKLDYFSNEFLTQMSTEELFERWKAWAATYDKELFSLMEKYPDLTYKALDIERFSEKDPRRFTRFTDLRKQLEIFYDETYEELVETIEFPENVSDEVRKAFVARYAEEYSLEWWRDPWFQQLKDIWKDFSFATNNEEWKTGQYIWKVWDLAMILRLLICWTPKTPDLHSVMSVLGSDKVKQRLLSR